MLAPLFPAAVRDRPERRPIMAKVKMTALDTFHVTSVQAEPLLADDKFEVSENEAKQLEERGLAKRVAAKKGK